MTVKVFSKDAHINHVALANPRDLKPINPGDNYFDDATWKRMEPSVHQQVKDGVYTVETGVKSPTPQQPAAQETKAPEDDEAKSEKKKRW